MDTTTEDPMLRKIRGLLALAEDPACTVAEAETYSAHAEKLMLKHSIDAALLDAHNPNGTTPGQETITVPGGYAMAKATLLTWLGQAFGCEVLYSSSRGETPFVYVIGFPADRVAVETLYTSLLLQGANALAQETRSDRAFRNAFWHGFANTAGQRTKAERQEAVREAAAAQSAAAPSAPGAALVLADRSKEVAAYRAREFGRTSSKRPSYSDRAGEAAGRAAGEAANLGQRGNLTGGRAALTA